MMVWFASGENLTLGTRLGGRLATLLSRSSPPRATAGLGASAAISLHDTRATDRLLSERAWTASADSVSEDRHLSH